MREPVDVAVVDDHEAVFTSQITEKDCAVAGTQMVLTILGLGEAATAFQTEIHDRIGEWESLDDSLNGGWGPAAVALALADYGATGLRDPRLRRPTPMRCATPPSPSPRWTSRSSCSRGGAPTPGS